MPPEEEKRQEKLLLLLLALATETERLTNEPVRKRLVDVMRRLRRLVQRMSPTGQFRIFEWSQLSPQALPLLEEITRTLRSSLLPQVQTLGPEVQDAAYDFSRPSETEPQEIRPQTQEQLLRSLQIAGAGSLYSLMGSRQGLNRYTLQMASDLDKMIKTMILSEATTQEISDKVLKVMTDKGRVVGKITTGSYANRMWNRVRNTTSAAVWDQVTATLSESWRDVPTDRWVYNAILDPETCPVCRPLNGMIRDNPAKFPRRPPVHPNCRCAVLPVLG